MFLENLLWIYVESRISTAAKRAKRLGMKPDFANKKLDHIFFLGYLIKKHA
jgi:hypothetical protein